MLNSLQLKNLATISDTSLEFEAGLNVLTGETGAGKSILIDGLLLALGDRADRNLVRPGSKLASVEAVFQDRSGEEMLIRREVRPEGRSRIFIDDELSTLEEARSRVTGAVDLHSQRSSPALLLRRTQQTSFDEFGKHSQLAAELSAGFSEYRSMLGRLELLRNHQRKKNEAGELAQHELSLIERLDPSRDDYVGLTGERRDLRAVQTAAETLNRIVEDLSEDNGIIARIRRFQSDLARVESDLGDPADMLEQAGIALGEAENQLRGHLDRIDNAPWRIQEIDERLDEYAELLGRCGGSLDNLLKRRRELEDELNRLRSFEVELSELEKLLPVRGSELYCSAQELSSLRLDTAKRLKKTVQEELHLLGMPDAVFDVVMHEPQESRSISINDRLFCSDGFETPEYYFSANRGLEPGPLSSVASGGELSRVSLVLKLALADVTQSETMVFDEIDSGIGGETAKLLAESLRRASGSRQVIVITHLAQIASRAQRHLVVIKDSGDDLPSTEVIHLHGRQDRIYELTRLLGGGDAAAQHAARMIEASEADSEQVGGSS